jgi:proteasome beta subunit
VTWPHREQLAFPKTLSGAPSVPVDISSFSDLLRRQAPDLLPFNRASDVVPSGALPHGTTIVALRYPGGVVMAGDRRSTQGNMIAGRDVKKVYITDD